MIYLGIKKYNLSCYNLIFKTNNEGDKN